MAPFGNSFSGVWEVFTLFVIPWGGGVPAGVLLARSRGIPWPGMTLLYFFSDVALACLFDPVMRLVIAAGKRSPRVMQVREAMKKSTARTIARYGGKLGPRALILLSFGADPMTGRVAAQANGYGFVAGWALAIAGDMLYFWMLMVSTLFLSGILGDGTWATVLIFVITMVVSSFFKPREAPPLPPDA